MLIITEIYSPYIIIKTKPKVNRGKLYVNFADFGYFISVFWFSCPRRLFHFKNVPCAEN